MINVRLIEKLTAELTSGRLWFVSGSNSKGKTTFIKALVAALSGKIPKDMLTNGEKSGLIDAMIEPVPGEQYRIMINLKEGKTPSFKIITPELTTSTRKTDLEHIFKWQNVTTDEFLGLGLTEAGRRKQAEYFIKLMPPPVRQRLIEIDGQVNEKDGTLYLDRRDASIQLKGIPEAQDMDDETIEMANSYKEWKEDYDKMLNQYQEDRSAMQDFTLEKDRIDRELSNIGGEIEELENKLEIAKIKQQQLKELRKDLVEPDGDLEQKKIELDASKEAVDAAYEAYIKLKASADNINKRKELKEKHENADQKITELRAEKKIIIENNFNIDGIQIEDGQLYYKEGEDLVPFTEESLSYSRAIITVADLMLKLNPNMPLVCLGKASELDHKSIELLANKAEKNDAIIVLDYVKGVEQGLTIEVFEQLNEEANESETT